MPRAKYTYERIFGTLTHWSILFSTAFFLFLFNFNVFFCFNDECHSTVERIGDILQCFSFMYICYKIAVLFLYLRDNKIPE